MTGTPAEPKLSGPALRLDALALALLTLGALALAYQVSGSYDLNTQGVTFSGFHASEGSGSRRFRWTDGQAVAHFDGIGSRGYRLTLNLSGPRPAGLPPPSAQVVVNGRVLASLTTGSAPQVYSFTLPAEASAPLGSLDIAIGSDTFVPPNDLRTLGVAVTEVRIEPLEGDGFTWPSPLVLGLGTLSVTAIYLAAGRRPAAWPAALAALGMLGAAVASERVLAAALMPWVTLVGVGVYAGARIKQRASWAETAAALAVLLSLLHFVLSFLNLFVISQFTDVRTMFEAAQKLAQGLDPYDYGVIRDNPLYAHSYVYPPAFAQFLSLLLPLGMQGAIDLWVALNFVLYFVALAGLLRLFRLRWRSAGMYALLVVAFNDQPVIDTLFGGQLDVLILALLGLALALARGSLPRTPPRGRLEASRRLARGSLPRTPPRGRLEASRRLALRGRMGLSGVALAFAAITKLHPLLLLPFYLARDRWRGLVGFGVAFALIVAVSVALSPPDLYTRYATIVLPGRGGGGTGNAENQSLAGFFYRASGVLWSDLPTPEQERVLRLWTYGAGALFGVATLAIVLYTLPHDSASEGSRTLTSLQFSLFIVLMLLILPTSWMHYETQLLLPLAALLAAALAARKRALFAAWAAGAALTAFGNWELFSSGAFDAWPLSLLQSYKLYGVLLVWGALAWAMLKEGRTGKPDRH